MQFFMKENTDANKKNAVDNYFSEIQDERYSQYLSPGERELSALLYQIGGYIASLNGNMSKYSSGTDISYSRLFKDLKAIADSDLKSKVEKEIYCIEIYKQAAYWLDRDKQKFISDGVRTSELNELITVIQNSLKNLGITKDSMLYGEYKSAVDTAETASQGINIRRNKEVY